MSEAAELMLKEIEDHAAWLREHAELVELPRQKSGPGTMALALVIRDAVLAEREACARVAEDERAAEIHGGFARVAVQSVARRIRARP
jgi:hypothetical protein